MHSPIENIQPIHRLYIMYEMWNQSRKGKLNISSFYYIVLNIYLLCILGSIIHSFI